jgi:hypothetical protein
VTPLGLVPLGRERRIRRAQAALEIGDPAALLLASARSRRTADVLRARSCELAFGSAQTCGWSSSHRRATWPTLRPCASPISASTGSSSSRPWANGE